MSKLKANITLKAALLNHSNDYGFEPSYPISSYGTKDLPNLSVIIPYYETGEIIKSTLQHLYNSLSIVMKIQKGWRYEVLLIDDGSISKKARSFINAEKFSNLKLLTNTKNAGITNTRNRGLKESNNSLCLFMDSDILIDNQLILNNLKTHAFNKKLNKKSCITISFFRFTNKKDPICKDKIIYPSRIMINDWRLYCLYQATWIGCEEDKKFIGQEIRIVQDTNYFKNWNRMYKAWTLSNMVLGGFFVVDRKDAVNVGGFDKSFKGYGFTETSLITKLIAIKDSCVIPIVIGGGVHIEDEKVNLSRKEKDKIFRQKHNYFFKTYLITPISEAVKKKLDE